MFAVKILQDSEADYDDEIELVITKFRQTFDFFTLTYGQQRVLLSQKLSNGKVIFESLTNASLKTFHIQYYSSKLKTRSPKETELFELPQTPEVPL
ncbi:unnamed protein product [Ambrosiozyma monospora]|uniref:Unnamed protein product n=1 Tax=Ambrosiozyma monospora TaxID=43982 RepID=A0ACB5U860_AMBMO|nr:unnamed protein product [Ambrosiozyma monospora]